MLKGDDYLCSETAWSEHKNQQDVEEYMECWWEEQVERWRWGKKGGCFDDVKHVTTWNRNHLTFETFQKWMKADHEKWRIEKQTPQNRGKHAESLAPVERSRNGALAPNCWRKREKCSNLGRELGDTRCNDKRLCLMLWWNDGRGISSRWPWHRVEVNRKRECRIRSSIGWLLTLIDWCSSCRWRPKWTWVDVEVKNCCCDETKWWRAGRKKCVGGKEEVEGSGRTGLLI